MLSKWDAAMVVKLVAKLGGFFYIIVILILNEVASK